MDSVLSDLVVDGKLDETEERKDLFENQTLLDSKNVSDDKEEPKITDPLRQTHQKWQKVMASCIMYFTFIIYVSKIIYQLHSSMKK